MEIFFIIFLTIVFICLIVYTAVQSQAKKQIPAAKGLKTVRHPIFIEGSGPAQEIGEAQDIPSDGANADDQTATFKEMIQANIHRIFSPEEGHPSASPVLPLTRDNIEKPIADEVMVQVQALKQFRSAHQRLTKILNDPGLQIGSELSKIVTSDPVLTAKILNTVNSPYFGMPQKVNSIGHALLLIGVVQIREILYRNGLQQLFLSKDPLHNEIVSSLWQHATLTSLCASHLHNLYPGLDRGVLFTMGLLHDIGKLILLKWTGTDKYRSDMTIIEEDTLFGINHAVIGRLALANWGFSELMISTIEYHHAPSFLEADRLNTNEQGMRYLIVLFLADQLAKLILRGNDAEGITPLLPSYDALLDRAALIRSSVDGVLLSSIIKSEVFADDSSRQIV